MTLLYYIITLLDYIMPLLDYIMTLLDYMTILDYLLRICDMFSVDKAELQKVVKQPNVVIDNLQAATRYLFFVVAYNSRGASAKSNVSYASTNQDGKFIATIGPQNVSYKFGSVLCIL